MYSNRFPFIRVPLITASRIAIARVVTASCLLLAIAIPTAEAAPVAGDAHLTLGSVSLTSCPIHDDNGDIASINGVSSWCGTLDRPWDPASLGAGSFPVAFQVLLPTVAANRTNPTLVGLQGGPGWGSISSAYDFSLMFGDLLLSRAMLVMDARGSGSSANIECDTYFQQDSTWQRSVADCAAHLGERFDLYSTPLASDDLAAILVATQLGSADIYGDSYGTFFAQVFAGRHPDLTRSLILDGAYPVLGYSPWNTTYLPAMNNALDFVCSRSVTCSADKNGGSARLAKLVTAVRKTPMHARVRMPSGRTRAVTITATAVLNVLTGAGYDSTIYRRFDPAAASAIAGDPNDLARLILALPDKSASSPAGNGIDSLNQGMMYAVACQDYPQLYDMSQPPRVRRQQFKAAVNLAKKQTPGLFAPFTIDEYLGSDWSDQATCLDWPVSTRYPAQPPKVLAGSYPNVPTLVISGDLDIVTTVQDGADTAKQFPNGHQVIMVNSVHVNGGEGCGTRIVRAFLGNANAVLSGAGTECASQIKPVLRALTHGF